MLAAQTEKLLLSLGYSKTVVSRMLAAAELHAREEAKERSSSADPLGPTEDALHSSSHAAPLAGITVVDLTRVLAGPFCTNILSELGARVIKVESSEGKLSTLGDGGVETGDMLRASPGFFAAANHSKECISLNLRSGEDRSVFERLLAMADVLVENYKPGIMESMGYGHTSVCQLFPKLVYCSISGFGHTGPDFALPAMDIVVQARSGLMSVTGHDGMPPTGLGVQLADMLAGIYAAIGIQGALARQWKTGKGGFVDISMLDCCASLLAPLLPRVGRGLPQPDRRGAASQHSAPFNVFECSDGEWIAIVGTTHHFWDSICKTLKVTEMLSDPRFTTSGSRLKNRKDMEEILQAAFREQERSKWMELLVAQGVPCAPVNKLTDVLSDPQLLARHMVVATEDGHIVPGNPLKISGCHDSSRRPASPAVNKHGDSIRAEVKEHSRL